MEAWRGTWERDRFRGDAPLDAYVAAVFRHPVGTVNYTFELWQKDSRNTTYSLPAYLDALAPLAGWMLALEPLWRADAKTTHSLPDYMRLVMGCGLGNVADLLPLWGRDASRWNGDLPDWISAVAKVRWHEGTELMHAVYAEDTVTTLTLPAYAEQLGEQDNDVLNVALNVWSQEPHRRRSFLDYVAFVAARLNGYTLETITNLWTVDTCSTLPFPDYGAYIEQFPWHHVQLMAQAWAGGPSEYCGFPDYLARSGQIEPPRQAQPYLPEQYAPQPYVMTDADRAKAARKAQRKAVRAEMWDQVKENRRNTRDRKRLEGDCLRYPCPECSSKAWVKCVSTHGHNTLPAPHVSRIEQYERQRR